MTDHNTPTSDILIEQIGEVQILRFNRVQKKNAITGEMYEALTGALRSGDEDPSIAVHLITGADGVFTAGNDLKDFLEFAREGAMGQPVVLFLKQIASSQKPMIAAVDGLAVGLGTTMLFHCDLVYATARSTFSTPFLNLGLVPEAASSLLMPRQMGYARAFEMLCLGEVFDAERAVQSGFVNRIVAESELVEMALKAANQLASRPPEALKAARKLLRTDGQKVMECMDTEIGIFAERLRSPEAREAFAAFLEKRPPKF